MVLDVLSTVEKKVTSSSVEVIEEERVHYHRHILFSLTVLIIYHDLRLVDGYSTHGSSGSSFGGSFIVIN